MINYPLFELLPQLSLVRLHYTWSFLIFDRLEDGAHETPSQTFGRDRAGRLQPSSKSCAVHHRHVVKLLDVDQPTWENTSYAWLLTEE